MMPIVMSMPHTGSHFMMGLFEQHYARHYFPEDIHAPNPYRFAHVDGDRCNEARHWLDDGVGELFMPLRGPEANIQSHLKRNKELDHTWRELWWNFWNLAPRAFILPIDLPGRDERLRQMGERLGVAFVTDWAPLGTYTGKTRPLQRGMSPGEALNWLRQFPFEDYGYGDTAGNHL